MPTCCVEDLKRENERKGQRKRKHTLDAWELFVALCNNEHAELEGMIFK